MKPTLNTRMDPRLDPPFDLEAFLAGHGFTRTSSSPDVYRHAHVEVENNGGHLYVRRYTSLGRRLIDWACAYGPGVPRELIIMAVLAAFTPVPVPQGNAGTWSVWAAVPLTVGVGLSRDAARDASGWLGAEGWPYLTYLSDGDTPPAGDPTAHPDS